MSGASIKGLHTYLFFKGQWLRYSRKDFDSGVRGAPNFARTIQRTFMLLRIVMSRFMGEYILLRGTTKSHVKLSAVMRGEKGREPRGKW